MKLKNIKYFLAFLLIIPTLHSFSQSVNDTIKAIFSSKSFSLEEEYIGDWGGYIHHFDFSVNQNNVSVTWENPELLKNGKKLVVLISNNEFKTLESIFINGTTKIISSKLLSTEHILYKFKTQNLSFTYDDKFTMTCYEEFKAWKKMLQNNEIK